MAPISTVMRRQRLTRRDNSTTLALRSSLGSTGGTTGGGSHSLRSGAGVGSASDLASEAVMESDTASGRSSVGVSGAGGMAIESATGSSVNSKGSSSAMAGGGGGTSGVSISGVGAPTSVPTESGGARGTSLGGDATPISALILSHTSGDGSTASTMTLSSPSRRSHCRTDAAKPGSSVSNASACSRSSAESVPSTYSAASASWASSYITAVVLWSCYTCPIHSRISSRLRRNHVLI